MCRRPARGKPPSSSTSTGSSPSPAIGLSCGGTSEAELRGAVEVYESPRALLDQLKGSAMGRLAARPHG
ncbi:hypothetical protein [Pseudarthrobacter albicanus]|uniref:hypothetical protein n=1 Tax=Pseudarthrobacter albicanus TaxID=2823873 RepID=UPI001BAAEF1C|nr:hypothetical protein [Pseudarthrobacter albicanus]